jgi:hypothetical protein
MRLTKGTQGLHAERRSTVLSHVRETIGARGCSPGWHERSLQSALARVLLLLIVVGATGLRIPLTPTAALPIAQIKLLAETGDPPVGGRLPIPNPRGAVVAAAPHVPLLREGGPRP